MWPTWYRSSGNQKPRTWLSTSHTEFKSQPRKDLNFNTILKRSTHENNKNNKIESFKVTKSFRRREKGAGGTFQRCRFWWWWWRSYGRRLLLLRFFSLLRLFQSGSDSLLLWLDGESIRASFELLKEPPTVMFNLQEAKESKWGPLPKNLCPLPLSTVRFVIQKSRWVQSNIKIERWCQIYGFKHKPKKTFIFILLDF